MSPKFLNLFHQAYGGFPLHYNNHAISQLQKISKTLTHNMKKESYKSYTHEINKKKKRKKIAISQPPTTKQIIKYLKIAEPS